eukprot:Gb_28163 [translate_table: standard]
MDRAYRIRYALAFLLVFYWLACVSQARPISRDHTGGNEVQNTAAVEFKSFGEEETYRRYLESATDYDSGEANPKHDPKNKGGRGGRKP